MASLLKYLLGNPLRDHTFLKDNRIPFTKLAASAVAPSSL